MCAVRRQRHCMPGVQRKTDGEGLAKGRADALWTLGAQSCGCVYERAYERERALGNTRTVARVRAGDAQASVLRARPGKWSQPTAAARGWARDASTAPRVGLRLSEWLVGRGVCPVGLRHSGTVFTCGQRGAVSFPEARSKGPQRGGAALD